MDEDHKLDHLPNRFTQVVAGNVEHNTNAVDVKVPCKGWVLLLVQSQIRIYVKIKLSGYQ